MLRGELGSEPMRFYKRPVLAALSYNRISKDPFPTPQEAQVWFLIGNETLSAFVPLTIVNEDEETVTASLIGECQGEIMVSFPPTNFGQTRFSASEEDLQKIASGANGRER